MRVAVDGVAYGLSPYGGLISYWNETLPRLARHFDVRVSPPPRPRAAPPTIAAPDEGWVPDVCISTYFTRTSTPTPSVLVVHDLIYEDGFISPGATGDPCSVADKRACIEAAAEIVVPSHATLSRLIHHYPDAVGRTS